MCYTHHILNTSFLEDVLYTSYSQHHFPCIRAIRIIFAIPVFQQTCYTHHIRNTSFSVDMLYASYSQHQFLRRRAIHILSCFQELCSKYNYVILQFLLSQIHRLGYGKVDQSQDFSEQLMPGIHKGSIVWMH